jgi:hypothetical protein
MSPSPPISRVPLSGAFSLPRTKCALLASSRVVLASASRSAADSPESSDPSPPLHAASATTVSASSGTPRRRSDMATLPVGRDVPAHRGGQ